MKRILLVLTVASILLLCSVPVLADDNTVQITPTSWEPLGKGVFIRLGQRITIPNRIITELAFPLAKYGSPIGDITFAIRRVSDDSIIASEVWGDASNLTGTWYDWYEVSFDFPALINEEVRFSCEWGGGDANNYVQYGYRSGDMVTGEYYTNFYHNYSPWHDIGEDEEGAYSYTYKIEVDEVINEVDRSGGSTTTAVLVCIVIIGVTALTPLAIRARRRGKH